MMVLVARSDPLTLTHTYLRAHVRRIRLMTSGRTYTVYGVRACIVRPYFDLKTTGAYFKPGDRGKKTEHSRIY